jgi:BASS family bile acid:Na+ symporter
MSSTVGTVQILFLALALVMVGLGLSLEIEDFRRIGRDRRQVAVGMAFQFLAMPALAFAMVSAFQVSPPYAVGLFLLAAAPGSISASIYSRIFGGNVALNMSLTGINTLLSMLTLPLICGWAQGHYLHGAADAVSPVGKLAEAMVTLSLPAALGMLIRAKAPAFAARADKPMRIISLLVLVAFSAGAIFKEWTSLLTGFAEVGGPVIAFNIAALGVGYALARTALVRESALAVAFELGVRSAVLSIYLAITTLHDSRIALPAAVYSITMVVFGMTFGALMKQRGRKAASILPAPANA